MLRSSRGDVAESALTESAIRLLDECASRELLASAETDFARAAARRLMSWRLPDELSAAEVVAQLLPIRAAHGYRLEEMFGREVVELAQIFRTWLSDEGGDRLELSGEQNAELLSLALRKLLRLVYVDRAGLPLILLALADHDARLRSSSATRSRAYASRAVFIPLAEMLGLWSVRRDWLTRCSCILRPEDYEQVAAQVKKTGQPEKLRAFAGFRDAVAAGTRDLGLGSAPRVTHVGETAGSLLRRADDGESPQELAHRVNVRVYCRSIDDCYRVLGAIHRLGKPVTTRYAERFNDFIASPHPNGYRGLHTSVLYEFAREDGENRKIPVHVRILTPEMHRWNEWGVLTPFMGGRQGEGAASGAGWWERLESREGMDQTPDEHGAARRLSSLREVMTEFEVGTQSADMYVFTPAGQAFSIPGKSTALDFAYRIHTDVGRHAARIQINGRIGSPGRELHNGDLVYVQYDPDYSGPDLSWLRFVRTKFARAQVRFGLLQAARKVAPAREKVMRELIHVLDHYHRERHYFPELTTGRLDAFLFRTMQFRKLPTMESLYQEIESGKVLADKLVNGVIFEELASMLVRANGEPMALPRHRISFCIVCRPIPGNLIAVVERQLSKSEQWLTVHQQSCKLLRDAKVKDTTSYKWSDRGRAAELVEFELTGEDRRRILGDLLDIVYAESSVELHKVEAQTYRDHPANIFITLKATDAEQVSHLHGEFELVNGVKQVVSYPVMHGEGATFAAPPISQEVNPYDESTVFRRYCFYDREEQTHELQNWLAEPPPTRVMILHGQRRVGKSALATNLIEEELPREGRVVPVLVDAHSLSFYGPTNLARLLAQRIFEKLSLPLPEQEQWEEPALWLNRCLKRAVEYLGERRLLIIMEEFSYLIELEPDGIVDPALFYNLRALIGDRRDVNWLFIVQNVFYKDSATWGSAGPLLQQASSLSIANLDQKWARTLIVKPAEQAGFIYEGHGDEDKAKDVAELALHLTAGNPYLIQALCRNMVDVAQKQRRGVISLGDLEYARRFVLMEGYRYFDHFVRQISDANDQAVLRAVARNSEPGGDPVLRAHITRELSRGNSPLFAEEIDHIVARLERVGIFDAYPEGKFASVRVAVPIFHQWVKINYISPRSGRARD